MFTNWSCVMFNALPIVALVEPSVVIYAKARIFAIPGADGLLCPVALPGVALVARIKGLAFCPETSHTTIPMLELAIVGVWVVDSEAPATL